MPVNRYPLEIRKLREWLGTPPRSPRQTNRLQESDCEILRLGPKRYLALNVDGVAEEIEAGLYRDPYTMGWVAAQATLSDLAACGARPLGFLSSAVFPRSFALAQKKAFQRGMNDALRSQRTPLLGGDHGESESGVFHGFAVGEVGRLPLSRVGIRAGDALCLVGSLGDGPALGFRFLLGRAPALFPEANYRPRARLDAGGKLLSAAHACIDTSDGFASAVHALSLLNDLRFEIDADAIPYSAKALAFCRRLDLPREALLFGEHGDYQLLAAVPADRVARLKRQIADVRVVGQALPKREKGHLLRKNGTSRLWTPGLGAEADKADLKKLRAVFSDMLTWCREL